jgi:hypothetical protein
MVERMVGNERTSEYFYWVSGRAEKGGPFSIPVKSVGFYMYSRPHTSRGDLKKSAATGSSYSNQIRNSLESLV